MKPLAITGFGVVSPLGTGWERFSAGLADASHDPFTTRTSVFDMTPYEGTRVAEAQGFDVAALLGATGLRNNDRLTKLLLVAARLALAHAGLKDKGQWLAYGPDDVGVTAANAYGSLEAIHELNLVARLEDPRYINPARFPNTVNNSSLGYVSIWEGLRALNATVVNGTTGALDAVGCAEMYLATRRAKAIVAGGAEALSEALHLGLLRTGALAEGVCTGEGASLCVLEPMAAARQRGADVRAMVIGYGAAFDPREGDDATCGPSRDALSRAISSALRDASVAPAEVDVVVTGASGWRSIDAAEHDAVRAVFGASRCVAAPKRLTGETLGASGAMALAATTAWMHGAPVRCALEGAAAPAQVRTAVITALGFHGNASALVVRRPE